MSTRYEVILSAVDKGVKSAFRGVREGANRARDGVGAFNKTMGNGNKVAGVLTGQLKALIGAYAGLETLKGLKDAAISAQSLDIGFRAILQSGQAAAAELDYLRSVSSELKLEFYSTADSYKGLLAAGAETSLGGAQIRDVFRGISEAGVALRLSNQDLQGSLQAVTQMLSKGKVTAEELRQQLGERLPSAVPLAAKALGVTTQELDKMLQRGEVTIEKFIPAFADALHNRYGPAAREAAQDSSNMQAALNQFGTAWMNLKIAVAESGFIAEATDILRQLSDVFKDPEFRQSIQGVAQSLFRLIGATVKFTIEHGKALTIIAGASGLIWAFKKLVFVIKSTKNAMIAMTGLGVLQWIGKLRSGLVGIQAAFMAAKVSAIAFYGAATVGATMAIAKIIEAVKAMREWRKAVKQAQAMEQLLFEKTGQVLSMYGEFKDVKIPGNLTKLAQEDLETLRKKIVKAWTYWKNLVIELEYKADQKTWLGTATEEALKAQRELPKAKRRLEELRKAMTDIQNMDSVSKPIEYLDGAILAGKEQMEAFRESAEAAYEAASSAAEKYGKKIQDLNAAIADREISLQDKIRDLRRENMSEQQAAADLRLEAVEKERAAREALAQFQQSGSQRDLELAQQFANQAESAWTEYARGGEQATEAAISGLERVNNILDQADKTQIDTFSQMKQDAESAMADIKHMVDEINASVEFNLPIELENLKQVRDEINDLIKDETKHITIKTTEARAAGGRVGMASGGRFPGDSKRDSIPVLARPGEGFVRNEALKVWDRVFGRGFFDGINAPWSKPGRSIMDALTGGMQIRLPDIKSPAPRMAYATGGRVSGVNPANMGTINLQLGNIQYPLQGDRNVIEELQNEITRQKRRRPNKT